MANKKDKQLHVVPVPHKKPDLDRLAKAIVALALKQLRTDRPVEPTKPDVEHRGVDGEAA
jgi:hypothetical protein